MASLGFVDIKVIRKLRVAFFSTGDELRSIGEGLQVGEIYDSNRYTLYGLLAHQHCQVSDLGVVRDDPEALRKILATTASAHDLIISSGGVSVGDADYVRQVFSELGEMVFWKVAMKPGRPLTFGKIQNAYFLGLPGNPVATMVSFNLFVKPALQKLAGETVSKPFTIKAITTDNLKKRIGRTEYQRGFLTQTADGRFLVSKTGNQSSGILLSMSKANCYIVLSAEQSQIAKGSEVTVQLFSEFGN